MRCELQIEETARAGGYVEQSGIEGLGWVERSIYSAYLYSGKVDMIYVCMYSM